MLQKSEEPKILLIDIETSPIVATTWGIYEQNIIWKEEEWHITCFGYKWLGDDKVQTVGLPDFKRYKKDPRNDYDVVNEIRKLFDEADIIVAHNGDEFDIKKSQARMAFHHMKPPSFFLSVDTKKVAKKHFKFDSNSLKSLLEYFAIGHKLETGGHQLWRDVRDGKPEAWKKMRTYCAGDITGLEAVYLHMRPWMTNHPIVSVTVEDCPKCGSGKLLKDGIYRSASGLNYQKWECQSCGGCRTKI
jgi:DNA polymerase elongation subunit (family B)